MTTDYPTNPELDFWVDRQGDVKHEVTEAICGPDDITFMRIEGFDNVDTVIKALEATVEYLRYSQLAIDDEVTNERKSDVNQKDMI